MPEKPKFSVMHMLSGRRNKKHTGSEKLKARYILKGIILLPYLTLTMRKSNHQENHITQWKRESEGVKSYLTA